MKKFALTTLALVAMVALIAAPTFAGEGCTGTTKTDAKMIGSKSSCSASAHKASASDCSKDADHASAMSALMNADGTCVLTKAECAELCESGNYSLVNMSIKGMTCGGCESSVKASLEKVDGVAKVAKVDHKSGTALVFVKKDMANSDVLVKTVTNKGYKAEIVPAVATSSTDAGMKQAGAKSGCSATCAKTCASKKTDAEKTGAEGTK